MMGEGQGMNDKAGEGEVSGWRSRGRRSREDVHCPPESRGPIPELALR